MKYILRKFWNYIEGINGLLFILYFIFIFSTQAFISDNFSISYFFICLFFITILSIIFCPIILRFLSKITIKNFKKNYSSIILKILFFIIPFLVLLFYYFAYYPGGFGVDSIGQYRNAIYNSYNDWHPVIQTILSIKLPLILTNGWIGSIILFQIIVISLVICYSLNVIYRYTNLKYTIISMLFIILNPQLGYISMYPIKDITFAIGTLLLLTYGLQIYLTKGTWLNKNFNTILFIIICGITTLIRHNAILFTLPFLFAVLFYSSKKRGLIITTSILILLVLIKGPLYSILKVDDADKRNIETVGLPMNIIAAVVKYNPDSLNDEIIDFAYTIAPRNVWEKQYEYGYCNNLKFDKRTDNSIIEEYGRLKVISMGLESFKSSPKIALKSLIKLTEASYTIYDKHYSFIKPMIIENEYGIKEGGNKAFQKITKSYSNFITDFFPHLFMFLGIMHLILIASILSKCKLNKFKYWKTIFFIIPVFTYNLGTTLLLTGIDDASRFFYYTFLLMPTLLIFFYKNERGSDII